MTLPDPAAPEPDERAMLIERIMELEEEVLKLQRQLSTQLSTD